MPVFVRGRGEGVEVGVGQLLAGGDVAEGEEGEREGCVVEAVVEAVVLAGVKQRGKGAGLLWSAVVVYFLEVEC